MRRSRIRTDPEKAREWQRRRKPLRQGKALASTKPLRRKTVVRKMNRERLAKRRAVEFGQHAEYIRSLPCVLAGHDAGDCGPSVAAHVRSRGAGGKASDLVPLCDRHHQEQHAMGILTFQDRYEVDLRAIADDLWLSRDAGWARGL